MTCMSWGQGAGQVREFSDTAEPPPKRSLCVYVSPVTALCCKGELACATGFAQPASDKSTRLLFFAAL